MDSLCIFYWRNYVGQLITRYEISISFQGLRETAYAYLKTSNIFIWRYRPSIDQILLDSKKNFANN
jgi:hypothetical protein